MATNRYYRPLRDRRAKEPRTSPTRSAAAAQCADAASPDLNVSASAARICSSAAGSSIVVRSPGSRPSASAWIVRRNSLPERVFGKQRDEVHGARSRDRAELAGPRWPSPRSASAPHLPAVATFDSILHDGERHRNLALERIGDADHRHLRRFPDAPARPPRSRACRADGRRR